MRTIFLFVCIVWISISFSCNTLEAKQQSNNRKSLSSVKYIALIINEEKYIHGWPNLTYQEKKINNLSLSLSKCKFNIVRMVNLSGEALKKDIVEFAKKYNNKKYNIFVFYFGHVYVDNAGYSSLIPIDELLPSAKKGLTGDKHLQVKRFLNILLDDSFSNYIVILNNSIGVNDLPGLHGGGNKAGLKIILSAGSRGEAFPVESHFLNNLIRTFNNAVTGKHSFVDIKEFCNYVVSKGIHNSWQKPWYKILAGDVGHTLIFAPRRQIETRGKLIINSSPEIARIRILNSKHKYKYSIDGLKLQPGKYHVEVSADGYETQKQSIIIRAGETVHAEIQLQKKESNIVEISSSLVKIGLKNYDVSFVKIKHGTFVMGGKRYNERPKHRQSIPHDYLIMSTEVSNKLFNSYLRSVGKMDMSHSGGMPDFPVVDINWKTARDFALWFSEISGRRCRLPTEAEWEYAARSGLKASLNANALEQYVNKKNDGPVPVGEAMEDGLGIHGMLGNVWEWCSDCWRVRYSINPLPGTAICSNRVIRGGSWRDSLRVISPAARNGIAYNTKADYIGFRVVCSK